MEILAINGGTPVRSKSIFYGKQDIDQGDINAVIQILKSDYLTCGPQIEIAETKLKQATDAQYATLLANGTAALHAAVFALDLPPGAEIITTPMTFAASANAILYNQATPVFADIDPRTYNISAKSIEQCITSKTRAIIAVDYTGQPADYEAIIQLCRKHHLFLIEDAAHSIGSTYHNKKVGSIADLTTFSFHPVKTVTSGEGGAVTCHDHALFERVKLFCTHGITHNENQMIHPTDDPWYYEQIILGYNYRLTDIQSALLTNQLGKLASYSKRRKQIAAQYTQAFHSMDTIIPQWELPDVQTTPHLYILQLNLEQLTVTRRQIFDALAAENIHCNVHYIPVYYHPYYESLGYKRGLCPHAEQLYERIISIPLYPAMSDQDINDVITGVEKVLQYYRKSS